MLGRAISWAAFSKVKILVSTSNNIHFNLATEEYLFETAELAVPTLFLWRNSPTIVIGRHQNPWKECRNEEMRAQGVLLSRRKTGGGAVYHDLGNTCFSFLTPYQQGQEYDYKTVNNAILVDAFQRLGVQAEVAGRNDIHCAGKKVVPSTSRFLDLPTGCTWEGRTGRAGRRCTTALCCSQSTCKPCRSISTPTRRSWRARV
jgi:lipoyltransferase/lipoate-protein ligase